MIRVGIVDDQQLIRDGIRLVLQLTDDLEVVAEATNGSEAVELATRHRPDVILMDIRMPVLDGIEATRRIAVAGVRSRVLILATFNADAYVYEALHAGAAGFLLKNAPREQLLAGIRIVAAGEALLAPEITRRLVERFVALPAPTDGAPAALAELSSRELEVLRQLARGRSNQEIADDLVISPHTAKTHVNRIMTKLSAHDRAQLVIAAYESGLLTPGA